MLLTPSPSQETSVPTPLLGTEPQSCGVTGFCSEMCQKGGFGGDKGLVTQLHELCSPANFCLLSLPHVSFA